MASATKPLTETMVRAIAREESMKILKDLVAEISAIRQVSTQNKDILGRLERILLGEDGVSEDETLKWKASFAYLYAKRNTDLKIVERAEPAIKWFEDMSECDPGEKESKLVALGKMITFYSNMKFFFGIIGITTLVNAIPIIETILTWVKSHL